MAAVGVPLLVRLALGNYPRYFLCPLRDKPYFRACFFRTPGQTRPEVLTDQGIRDWNGANTTEAEMDRDRFYRSATAGEIRERLPPGHPHFRS